MGAGRVGQSTFNALCDRIGRLVLLAGGVLWGPMCNPVYGLSRGVTTALGILRQRTENVGHGLANEV